MDKIVNYYSEFNLEKELGIEDINKELNRLESIWKRREMTTPEKALKILSLIIDARQIFATEESRREYEKNLECSKETSDDKADEAKRVEFKKALDDANEYEKNNEYDLAKLSIDKAFQLKVYCDDLAFLYLCAYMIYSMNGLYEASLGFINQTIAESSPDDIFCLTYYRYKIDTLNNIISVMKKNHQDTSKVVRNYRSTCKVYAQKAKEKHADENVVDALLFLSEGYCNYEPKDFDLAEQCALEILKYDSNDDRTKQILRWLDAPKAVAISELQKYENEVSPFERDITDLASKIISQGLMPECELGWIMTKKDFTGWYTPNKDGMDEQETATTTFALNREGRFIKYTIRETEYWRPGQLPAKSKEEHRDDCSLLEVMMEMDFDAYKYHTNDIGWAERSYSVGQITFCWAGESTRELTRKYRKKGQGLYNRLKGILDQFEKYMQARQEYEAKFVPLKEKAEKEYEVKRHALILERNKKVDDVKEKLDYKISLQNSISTMKSELELLWFFQGKRKKDLQAKIAEAEQELLLIPSVEQISKEYQKKINELNLQEEKYILSVEEDLKGQYPLLQQRT